jgi:predicted Zn finger-like uncharacterized protein
MDVACPACAAKYTADEEKLRGKKARMRCKACNTAWIVTGPGANEDAAAISIPPPASIPPPSAKPASLKPASMKPPSLAPTPGSIAPPRADKQAAVVKTGSEREKRDMFADQPADEGKVKDTLLPPPSYGFSGTGARSENSVLFRVDQLAGMAGRIHTPEPERVAAPVIQHKTGGGDEEGVIDLKALASVPPPGKRSIIPVAPLFSEPPPMMMDVGGGGTGSKPAIAKPISTGKIVAAAIGAVAFLALAGVGISFAFKGEDAVQRPAAITPPAPAPTPSASVAAPTPSADPASSVASNDDDSPKKGKKRRLKKGGANAAGAGPPVKPKAADPCGCHGDFNCILACTANRGH